MSEPSVSNNKVHIPLILVLGFILSAQIAMAVYFFNWNNNIATDASTEIEKIKLNFEQYKTQTEQRIALMEQANTNTTKQLEKIESGINEIRSLLLKASLK